MKFCLLPAALSFLCACLACLALAIPPAPSAENEDCQIPQLPVTQEAEEQILDRVQQLMSDWERSADLQMESLAEFPQFVHEHYSQSTTFADHVDANIHGPKRTLLRATYLRVFGLHTCNLFREEVRQQTMLRVLAESFSHGRRHLPRPLFLAVLGLELVSEMRMRSVGIYVELLQGDTNNLLRRPVPNELSALLHQFHMTLPLDWKRYQKLVGNVREALEKFPDFSAARLRKMDETLLFAEILQQLAPLLLRHAPSIYVDIRFAIRSEFLLSYTHVSGTAEFDTFVGQFEADAAQCTTRILEHRFSGSAVEFDWRHLYAASQVESQVSVVIDTEFVEVSPWIYILRRLRVFLYELAEGLSDMETVQNHIEIAEHVGKLSELFGKVSHAFLPQCQAAFREKAVAHYGKHFRAFRFGVDEVAARIMWDALFQTFQSRALAISSEKTFAGIVEELGEWNLFDPQQNIVALPMQPSRRKKKSKRKAAVVQARRNSKDTPDPVEERVECTSEKTEPEQPLADSEQPALPGTHGSGHKGTKQTTCSRRRTRWWLKDAFQQRQEERARSAQHRRHSATQKTRKKGQDLCLMKLPRSAKLIQADNPESVLKPDDYHVLCKVLGRLEGTLRWREFSRLVVHLRGSVEYLGGSSTRVTLFGSSAVLDRPHPSDEFPFGKRKYTQKLFERVFGVDLDGFEVLQPS